MATLELLHQLYLLTVLHLNFVQQSLLVLDLSLAQLKLLVLLVEREKLLALCFEFLDDSLLLSDHAAKFLVLTLVNAVVRFQLYEPVTQL